MKLFVLVLLVSFSSYAKPQQNILTFSSIEKSPYTLLFTKIMKKVYSEIDIEIHVKKYPPKRASNISLKGGNDGELHRVDGFSNKESHLIKVPSPIFSTEIWIFSHNKLFDFSSIEKLNRKRVAIRRGIKFLDEVTKGYNSIKVNSYIQCIKLVASERADLTIIPSLSADLLLQKKTIKNVYKASTPFAANKVYHYVNSRHKNLVPKIDKALVKLHKDGTIRKIYTDFLRGNKLN